MGDHLPRVSDGELSERLAAMGAVLVEGPKARGRTATASQVSRTAVRLDRSTHATATRDRRMMHLSPA